MSRVANTPDTREIISLIIKVRDGDQNAFQRLVERYQPLIESLVHKFFDENMSTITREDLHQEAVLRFYNSILTYDVEQSEVEFGLYAKICISNALVSQLRLQKKYTAEQLAELRNNTMTFGASEDPTERILEEERVKALYSLIRLNLSSYEYRIWQLYMSGYTSKDISVVVGSDEKSISNAIYRVRKKLRSLLI